MIVNMRKKPGRGFGFTFEDFKLVGYEADQHIKALVAI